MGPVELSAFPADVGVVRTSCVAKPSLGLVLGSGLDAVVEALADRVDIPYQQLDGMRVGGAVPGHTGALSLGTLQGVSVMCFRGRTHAYQGASALEAAYPALLAADVGAEIFVVTNAAGSVDPSLAPGSVMLIRDHLNLTGDNPLVGWPGPSDAGPFVSMGDAYDTELLAMARREASNLGMDVAEGVYAGVLGPSYETAAEARYLRAIGASAVGMSTVHEVIAARARGLRVLGLSSITNRAGGSDLSHVEVLAAGAKASAGVSRLMGAVLGAVSRS